MFAESNYWANGVKEFKQSREHERLTRHGFERCDWAEAFCYGVTFETEHGERTYTIGSETDGFRGNGSNDFNFSSVYVCYYNEDFSETDFVAGELTLAQAIELIESKAV
jgi:hypothetical protein